MFSWMLLIVVRRKVEEEIMEQNKKMYLFFDMVVDIQIFKNKVKFCFVNYNQSNVNQLLLRNIQ